MSACASSPDDLTDTSLRYSRHLPEPDLTLEVQSLSNCTQADDSILRINSKEPVTIIVHGCYSSAGRFRHLADIFAFHGQQAICFNYNDRDRLGNSSAELVRALGELSVHLDQAEVTVVGHSQGGLLSRRALIAERPDRLQANGSEVRLVTISAPFGGIEASSHCGSRPLAWLSLGVTKLICQIVTGSKYREIPPNSEFINSPGSLLPLVDEHINIVTDERDSCRRYDSDGKCVEDDFVFSVAEQTQAAINDDRNLSSVVVKSGHVQIVGNGQTEPTQLIDLLQQHGVLNPTLPGEEKRLSQLIERLYLDEFGE